MDKKDDLKKKPFPFESQDLFLEESEYAEFNDYVQQAAKIIEEFGTRLPKDIALDYFRVLMRHQRQFEAELSASSKPMTMAKLEALHLEKRKLLDAIDVKSLAEDLACLEKNKELIALKKKEYLEKGIRLRSYQQYRTTIMTTIGPIKYQRMALRPSFDEDKRKLMETGVEGYIYPLDDYLGLSQLPFKMTIDAMLIVAKTASKCESYEDAEQTLKELTPIHINDDTIRAITNTIGGLVHAHDLKNAGDILEKFNTGHLIFPEAKKNHTLYLQCDGVMIATRANPADGDEAGEGKGVKGVKWRENKLGLAFSSDNIRYWHDKHGKLQHIINKREYIALIDNCNEFSRMMLYLAIKNGYGLYKNTVLISDGATWIRNMKEVFFHDAIQILDFYHLAEHIFNFAKEVFDFDEKIYDKWAHEIISLFRNSETQGAITKIKQLSKRQLGKANSDILQYIDNNKNSIDYLTYRKCGYFIGSGAIESGNKIVLQRRMKHGGMRWNIDSGQAVLALNAKRRSDLWSEEVVDVVYNHYTGCSAKTAKDMMPLLA
jgi:hypothetical protein